MITGFTCGTWDLLHPGHHFFINSCVEKCDRLIVGLHTNPQREREWKNRPIQTIFERYVQLASLLRDDDDEIIPYDNENDLVNMMAILDFDVRFIGSDYANKLEEITGYKHIIKRVLAIEIIDRDHNYSSSELRKRIENNGTY